MDRQQNRIMLQHHRHLMDHLRLIQADILQAVAHKAFLYQQHITHQQNLQAINHLVFQSTLHKVIQFQVHLMVHQVPALRMLPQVPHTARQV